MKAPPLTQGFAESTTTRCLRLKFSFLIFIHQTSLIIHKHLTNIFTNNAKWDLHGRWWCLYIIDMNAGAPIFVHKNISTGSKFSGGYGLIKILKVDTIPRDVKIPSKLALVPANYILPLCYFRIGKINYFRMGVIGFIFDSHALTVWTLKMSGHFSWKQF